LLFIEAIYRANEVEVTWIDAVRHQQAMKLLTKRRDKRWTLCDGVSFLLMSDSKISDALTTDHNFEQAGFTRLLSS
jgi:predicted nucleic acid-binding protein